MSQFNFPGAAAVVSLLAAGSKANTAAATGSGVDLQAYEGPVVITQDHGASTGTLDGKIQDSADNSSFADVSGLTFTQETTTAGIQKLVVQSKQVRRYIKYVGTVGTGPQVVGVSMLAVPKIV
jgi:hypothetical protein